MVMKTVVIHEVIAVAIPCATTFDILLKTTLPGLQSTFTAVATESTSFSQVTRHRLHTLVYSTPKGTSLLSVLC